jgi:2-keto-4-pentenoate hydratase/2-oxohepta-3-ene-1,7-dioic acid hydratase in catechol pathway
LRARVNGAEWASGNTRDMRFTFEEMIAAISQDETLYPGDVIGSGTVPGGCGLELDRWLQPGDIVELEADGIGLLRNRIVKP